MELGHNYIIHSYKHNGNIHRAWDEAVFIEETDEIISNLRAAIEISVHDNEKLKSQVQRKIGMEGYTSEHEVLKTF